MSAIDVSSLAAEQPFFADFSAEDLKDLSGYLERRNYAVGDTLVSQGALADGVYLIAEGTSDIFRRLPGGGENLIGQCGQGTLLGESALILGCRRTATVRAASPLKAIFLDRRAYLAALQSPRPSTIRLLRRLTLVLAKRLRAMQESIKEHVQRERPKGCRWPLPSYAEGLTGGLGRSEVDVHPLLSGLPFFRDVDQDVRDRIFAGSEVTALPRGKTLLAQGQASDTWYIVLRGAIASGIVMDETLYQFSVEGPGWLVGGEAMVDGLPCDVNYFTREVSVLLRVPRPLFDSLASGSDRTARSFMSALTQQQVMVHAKFETYLMRVAGMARLKQQAHGVTAL